MAKGDERGYEDGVRRCCEGEDGEGGRKEGRGRAGVSATPIHLAHPGETRRAALLARVEVDEDSAEAVDTGLVEGRPHALWDSG